MNGWVKTPNGNGDRVQAPKVETVEADIDSETKRLKIRKAQLQQLLQLKLEVESLERKALGGKTAMSDAVFKCIFNYYSVTGQGLKAKQRGELKWPRHVFFYLMREVSTASLSEIGALLQRDHGTVINACKAVRDRMDIDEPFKAEVQSLLTLLLTGKTTPTKERTVKTNA